MADYHIRRATVDDYAGVMDIGDVYFGNDYLRGRYHLFMNDPNATSYVYVVGEEIVGFCTAFLIDDGLTFLVRASRVKKDFQGQGVYGRLMKHVYAEYKDVDSIRYDTMTTNDYNFNAKKDGLKKTHTEVSRKCFLNYQFKMEDIDSPTLTTDLLLEEVNSSVMMSLFGDKNAHKNLFPEGKIIVDWVPLRLLPANMKYILESKTLALQSRGDNSLVSLLTVGTPIRCERGTRYSLDVFGSDASALPHHMTRHLEYLRSLTQEYVVFQIIAVFELENMLKDFMHGLRATPLDTPMSEMIYFEKTMSTYQVRRATADDFDGVMDIGDVYFGTDYLRHRYHSFMDDRNARSYVYIIGKEIVGFCTAFLIDDGLTFLVRASRVKKDFQGQGVYGRLMKHVYAEYKDVDSIKYDAISITTNGFKALKKHLEKTHTDMFRKTILSYCFRIEDVNVTPEKSGLLEEVNSSTMMALFEDEKTRDTLFPEGKILIDWVPLRLYTSNMKYIMTVDTLALRSISGNSEASLLTVGTPTECHLGLRYIVDVFGSDVTVLRHHVTRHLEHLKALTQKDVVFEICASSDFGKSVAGIMEDARISPFPYLSDEVISLEKGFQ
ncbi:uncharacterized protein [Haliotis asinina]|uniref:uncharacterized protein n=1 Tax=Haliotis asinina TaxID=109174 RepID=UPI003532580F